jgi:hypothetical protein
VAAGRPEWRDLAPTGAAGRPPLLPAQSRAEPRARTELGGTSPLFLRQQGRAHEVELGGEAGQGGAGAGRGEAEAGRGAEQGSAAPPLLPPSSARASRWSHGGPDAVSGDDDAQVPSPPQIRRSSLHRPPPAPPPTGAATGFSSDGGAASTPVAVARATAMAAELRSGTTPSIRPPHRPLQRGGPGGDIGSSSGLPRPAACTSEDRREGEVGWGSRPREAGGAV